MATTRIPFLNFSKAAKALALGALYGSGGTIAAVILPGMLMGGPSAVPGALMLTGFLAFIAVPVWFIAMVVIGYPAWVLTHLAGLRGWLAAILVGAMLAAVGSVAFATTVLGVGDPPVAVDGWENGRQTIRNGAYTEIGLAREKRTLLFFMAVGAVGGGCAGIGLWRVAYRREEIDG